MYIYSCQFANAQCNIVIFEALLRCFSIQPWNWNSKTQLLFKNQSHLCNFKIKIKFHFWSLWVLKLIFHNLDTKSIIPLFVYLKASNLAEGDNFYYQNVIDSLMFEVALKIIVVYFVFSFEIHVCLRLFLTIDNLNTKLCIYLYPSRFWISLKGEKKKHKMLKNSLNV